MAYVDVIKLKRFCTDMLIDEKERAQQFIPPVAVDSERQIFWCDDQTLACAFECQPLVGGANKEKDKIDLLLNQTLPSGSTLSFLLFRSPDITPQLSSARQLRQHFSDPVLTDIFEERLKFLGEHTTETIVSESLQSAIHNIGRIVDLKLIVSLKIPTKGNQPTEAEETEMIDWTTKTRSALRSIGFAPVQMDPEHYLRVVNTLLNWGDSATWKGETVTQWDRDKPLGAQCFDFDTSVINARPDMLQLGSKGFVKVLSAKRMPERTYFGSAMSFVGDVTGLGQGITQNYAICCNIYYPDIESSAASLEKRRQYAAHQTFGPLLKFDPILASIKKSYDTIYESRNKGARPLRISYHLAIFGQDENEVLAAASAAQSQWTTMRYTMKEDTFVMLPIFFNMLPMGCDHRGISELWRYKTMTAHEASVVIPIFGESKGTGTQHVQLLSRTGQLMSLSLHDSNTNQNAVIAAESGSGKSFLLNELILSYMSEGAQVWVIDAGKSYKKLCELLQGDFVEFGDKNKISLNPFQTIVKWEDEEDAIVSLVATMASKDGKLNDLQMAALKSNMREIWQQTYALSRQKVAPQIAHLDAVYGERVEHLKSLGLTTEEFDARLSIMQDEYDQELLGILPRSTMSIDMIADRLLKDPDPRVHDIGVQLSSFTSNSAYGRFFAGDNTADFSNNFTVLELDELQGRKHLRQVVLLQLISQIQREIFLGERKRKKLVIIDEAWDLLKEGEVSKFMEGAYRKFRKYGASAIIATQSIQDLYNNPVGKAIAENSANMFLLGQKASTIEQVRQDKKLVLDEWGFHTLKGVHTEAGVFSEIFIMQGSLQAVGRLVVSDFQKLLYSTAPQDVTAIAEYQKQGMKVMDAIRAVLRDRQARF